MTSSACARRSTPPCFPPILTVGIVLPKDGGFDITDITDFDDDNVGVTPASKK